VARCAIARWEGPAAERQAEASDGERISHFCQLVSSDSMGTCRKMCTATGGRMTDNGHEDSMIDDRLLLLLVLVRTCG